jgi:hypothetical protein
VNKPKMRTSNCLNVYLLVVFGAICQFNNLSTHN